MCQIEGCGSDQSKESVMNITTVGIDLAKNVFSVHGVDAHGKTVLKKTVSRNKLLECFTKLPTAIVGMEACSGAHHWARQLRSPRYAAS
jgi:transposase